MPRTVEPKEKVEREKFILDRIRMGMSRNDIQTQYCNEFDLSKRSACLDYKKVLDNLWDNDDSVENKRRTRSVQY
jgi:hypothetical protein